MNVLENILYPVLAEARASIESAKNLVAAPGTALFGVDGLSSLDLVSFIILAEEKVDDETGVKLTLASEQAMSRRSSPFRTLQTLADYIVECLTEAGHHG